MVPTTDLHAAIRERLETYVDEGCGYSGHDCRVTGHAEMKAALLAVLDVHDPIYRMQAYDTGEWYGGDGCREALVSANDVVVCTFADDGHAEERYVPCPTTLAIAEKLGIEVDCDG